MTTTAVPPRNVGGPAPARGGLSRLWARQLPHYPDTGPRSTYLAITVLATVVLYYELYIPGAVATNIIADLHIGFTFFVFVSVVGNLVGAFASLFAGLADRWGRANLVVGGLLVTALIIGVGLPNASSKGMYMFLFAVLSFVEGIVLVATPALIRDFSPQVGRGTAMGFWTLGPVLGSLAVTEISSHTLNATGSNWRFEFQLCGIIGAVVWLVALVGLRELSPAIRDQLMVSMRDRALVEARAAGIDPDRALKGHWRQMMKFDVLGSAFAISIYLLLYYILVGFTVVYFATVYDYPAAKANSLANWYWIADALALVVVGLVSDRFRVRKPFMVIGTLIGLVGSVLFALSATHQQSYHTIAVYFILSAVGGGMAYVAWMASFTETVERHNPAATATGLALWGWIIRLVITASLAILTLVIPAASTLVDKSGPIVAMQTAHPTEFAIITTINPADAAAVQANPTNPPPAALASVISATAKAEGAPSATQSALRDVITNGELGAATVLQADPATAAALQANPRDQAAGVKAVTEIATALKVDAATATKLLTGLPAALPTIAQVQKYGADLTKAGTTFTPDQISYLKANGPAVAKAASDSPHQWQTWWWVCVACQVLFLPFIFVMAGRWSPRKAREDERAHEEMVQRELAALQGAGTASSTV